MMKISRMGAPMVALVVATTGCGGGALGDILGGVLTGGDGAGAGGGTVTVEVQQVRERTQEIVIRTQEGQTGPVLYDQNTRVVYQNQDYPVRALEAGDIVDMRVQQVQQGYYTDLIQVRTPVQERQGGYRTSPSPEVYRVEGTIGQVDLQRAAFTLNMTQGGTVTVELPSNAPQSTRDRLRDYRSGDYVRVEIRPVDQQRAELVRWGWS